MGKINLDSIKSCLETANDSYKKMKEDRKTEKSVNADNKHESIDSMLDNANEMIKIFPPFHRT